MALLLCALACTGASAPAEDSASPDDDSGADPDTTDSELTCDELRMQIEGADPPHVGDTWTVFLYCDEIILTGAGRLSFEPPDFASIDTNAATFLYAGTATMKMQMGTRRAERTVEVLE